MEIVSKTPEISHRIHVCLHFDQVEKQETWDAALQMLIDLPPAEDANAWEESQKWWAEFWNRSRLAINSGRGEDDAGWRIGRNFQLFRYMLASNVNGRESTQFNGGLFTFDPLYVNGRNGPGYTPDHRQWGAGLTAQNQRMMVWPTGNIGLGSDPEWLKIVQDDVKSWPEHEWINTFNGFRQTYTTAVRVDHDPHDTRAKLRQQLATTGFSNLSVFGGGGGIENCCGVPATINEMLLQSHQGVLRLFPVGSKEQAARFGRLRTCGAFLVSSQLCVLRVRKGGRVPWIIPGHDGVCGCTKKAKRAAGKSRSKPKAPR